MEEKFKYIIKVYEYGEDEKSTRDIQIETDDKTIILELLSYIGKPQKEVHYVPTPMPVQPINPNNPWNPWTTPVNPAGPYWTGTGGPEDTITIKCEGDLPNVSGVSLPKDGWKITTTNSDGLKTGTVIIEEIDDKTFKGKEADLFCIDDVVDMLQNKSAGKDKNEESEFEKHKCKWESNFQPAFKGGY